MIISVNSALNRIALAGVGVWTLIEKHPSLVLLTSGLYDLTAYILILAGKGYNTSDGGAAAEWSKAMLVREKTKTKRSQVCPPDWAILKKEEIHGYLRVTLPLD